jgi:cell division septation protein DedD
MEKPANQFSNKKAVYATALLVSVISFILWLQADKLKKNILAVLPTNTNTETSNTNLLFYKSVGVAPEDFKKPTTRTTRKTSYTLEITAVRSKAKADRIVKALAKKSIQAFYTPLNKQGHVIYRIRTGVFPSQKQANRTAKRLKLSSNILTKTSKLQ